MIRVCLLKLNWVLHFQAGYNSEYHFLSAFIVFPKMLILTFLILAVTIQKDLQ